MAPFKQALADDEQVADLAFKYPADGCQGGEPDSPCPVIFQDGEVRESNPDLPAQFCQRHTPLLQKLIEPAVNHVLVGLFGRSHRYTSPSVSRCS